MSPVESGAGHGETVHLVCAEADEGYVLGLVRKVTYTILDDGSCVPAPEQRPIVDDAQYEDEPEPPLVASPTWDDDCFAFKPLTDLVVRGSARTYGRPATETMVEVRVGNASRTIHVQGDRVCEWSTNGTPVFSAPLPFEVMPLRYERAYGGVDLETLEREGDVFADTFRDVRPEWQVDSNTWCHYPRNPAGRGYVIAASQTRSRPVPLPNLEFPFDPVTPERLMVPAAERWMAAPLPACFDWCDVSWFPRCGYLGLTPPYAAGDAPPPEAQWGFAAPDILQSRRPDEQQFRYEFLQGASAGLVFQDLRPGEAILVRNMFERSPEFVVRLPTHRPRMAMQPQGREAQEMQVHLNTVVLDTERRELVMVWGGRLPFWRPFGPDEPKGTPYWIGW